MIAVAMSGGVDSSAAAVLLKQQGHSIVGLSMQLWNQRKSVGQETDTESKIRRSGRCCSPDDIWDARRVATHIGFPFYVVNLEDEFERTVVRPFVGSYLKGETPSPCILCNNFVKFRHLVERAEQIGADYVATGHYARVRYDEQRGRWLLLRGRDKGKDQSYFLFGLTQAQLARTIFPLGEMTKTEVRALARDAGIPTYDKPESQEICFVQEGSYRDFIENYTKTTSSAGDIVNLNGRVVGAHTGLHGYTVGQRKGLGAIGKRQYVVRLDTSRNQLVIGDDEDTNARVFRVRDTNWIAITPPRKSVRCHVQIRNRFKPSPATLISDEQGTRVHFEEPQRAITPGQAAVFYQGDIVLGGGWIC